MVDAQRDNCVERQYKKIDTDTENTLQIQRHETRLVFQIRRYSTEKRKTMQEEGSKKDEQTDD